LDERNRGEKARFSPKTNQGPGRVRPGCHLADGVRFDPDFRHDQGRSGATHSARDGGFVRNANTRAWAVSMLQASLKYRGIGLPIKHHHELHIMCGTVQTEPTARVHAPRVMLPTHYTNDKFTSSQASTDASSETVVINGGNHNLGNNYVSQESSEQSKWYYSQGKW
jgi:hypothetical protein